MHPGPQKLGTEWLYLPQCEPHSELATEGTQKITTKIALPGQKYGLQSGCCPLVLVSCVTSGKSPNLSEPSSPHLHNWGIYHPGVVREYKEHGWSRYINTNTGIVTWNFALWGRRWDQEKVSSFLPVLEISK